MNDRSTTLALPMPDPITVATSPTLIVIMSPTAACAVCRNDAPSLPDVIVDGPCANSTSAPGLRTTEAGSVIGEPPAVADAVKPPVVSILRSYS